MDAVKFLGSIHIKRRFGTAMLSRECDLARREDFDDAIIASSRKVIRLDDGVGSDATVRTDCTVTVHESSKKFKELNGQSRRGKWCCSSREEGAPYRRQVGTYLPYLGEGFALVSSAKTF